VGGLVEVTVPQGHHLRSRGFVVVHQSRRPVADDFAVGRLRVCPPARAAVDVALTATRRRDVDHVVADVLQRALCTVPDLDGNAIMQILGIPPGREVGEAWRFLKDLRLERGPLPPDEAEAALRTWWSSRGR
jgi:hypothetical protein